LSLYNNTMKKLIIIFLLSFICISGQNQIEGIGPYKLGKTAYSTIDSILKKQNLKEVLCVGDNCAYQKLNLKGVYIKKVANTKDILDNGYNDYYLENSFVILVKNLKINNKYIIGRAEFQFINNILYKFNFTDPDHDLIGDLELKYGKPPVKSLDKDERCSIRNESFTFKTTSYFNTWKSEDEQTRITYMIAENRSDEGCERNISLRLIGDTKIPDNLEIENRTKKAVLEQEKKEIKLNTLKDL
jgi:hypothetical protein